MAKVSTTMPCQFCKSDIKLNYTKPSAFQPSIVRQACQCGCRFMFRIKHKVGDVHGVTLETKVEYLHPVIRAALEVAVKEKNEKAAARAAKAMEGLRSEGGAP